MSFFSGRDTSTRVEKELKKAVKMQWDALVSGPQCTSVQFGLAGVLGGHCGDLGGRGPAVPARLWLFSGNDWTLLNLLLNLLLSLMLSLILSLIPSLIPSLMPSLIPSLILITYDTEYDTESVCWVYLLNLFAESVY